MSLYEQNIEQLIYRVIICLSGTLFLHPVRRLHHWSTATAPEPRQPRSHLVATAPVPTRARKSRPIEANQPLGATGALPHPQPEFGPANGGRRRCHFPLSGGMLLEHSTTTRHPPQFAFSTHPNLRPRPHPDLRPRPPPGSEPPGWSCGDIDRGLTKQSMHLMHGAFAYLNGPRVAS